MIKPAITKPRTPIFWLVAILLGALMLYLLMLPAAPELEWGDSGTYIAMAQSLLAGKGLSLTYLPTEPAYPIVPVGYPLALAPLAHFFPTWFLPLRLLSVALTLVTIVLVYLYTRPQLHLWAALAVTALFASNVLVVKSAAQAMSEAMFLCCTMLVFVLADRFVQLTRTRWYDVLLLALAVALPVSIRYLGLPISAAVAFYVFWHRRDRAAVGVGGGGVILALLLNIGLGGIAVVHYFTTTFGKLFALLLPQGSGPGIEAANATTATTTTSLGAAFSSLWYLFTASIPGTLVPLFHGPRIQAWFNDTGIGFVPALLQLAIVLSLVVGFVLQVRKTARAAEWSIFAYCVTLALVPTQWDTLGGSAFRYWIPLTLVGYQYIFMTLDSATTAVWNQWTPTRHNAYRLASIALIVVGLLALNIGRDVQESLINPIVNRVPDIFLAREWMQVNTPDDATILVANRSPVLYSLYFQREVVPTPDDSYESPLLYAGLRSYQEDPTSDTTFLDILNAYQVDYIAIAPERWPDIPLQWSPYVQNTLLPLVEAQPEGFPLVWSSADGFTRVFQVHRHP